MKYRKLPIVIEAVVYNEDGVDGVDIPEWMQEALSNGTLDPVYSNGSSGLAIKTLEGIMRARPGDYIIKGINGEIYPCKADIFLKTYEPVI